jgi:hypothetical protein
MPYPMGVFEALVAWQQGEITYRRALRLVGVDTIADLYAAAHSSGVPIRLTLSDREIYLSDRAIALIDRELELEKAASTEAPGPRRQ